MKKAVIICIDDERTILESLKINLKRLLEDEYLIETAEGGEEALELVAELLEDNYEIAVAISDYIMPGLKGDELLKRLHNISPKTLKIMLTGQADIEAVGNAIKHAKLYRYIAKPWQAEDLKLTVKEAVHSYFQEKKLEEQNAKLQQLNEELENLVEQRTAELRLSEEKFAKAFRASPSAIAITAIADGRHLEVNDAFCQMIAYPREEIVGRNSSELNLWVHPEKRSQLFEILREKRAICNYEFEFRTKLGEVKTGLLSAEIVNIHGRECLLAISNDISDRKQTELELQRAKESADRANRAKSEFLSNMSHELRTPLNAILGFTQLLARDATLAPQQQEYLEIINRSGEHLLSLIDNILQMSKIEVGRVTLDKNSFDLYRLLNTLEEMLQLQAQKKNLQLIFDRHPNLPQYVKTDENKLRQVLINLLGNALKFTAEGGVTLRVKLENRGLEFFDEEGKRERYSPFASLSYAQSPLSNPVLVFEVQDTGPGISPDEIGNLFKPFMQTETGRKAQTGTGLGLPISRQFVQLMGGDISVSSTLGKGTIFKFDVLIDLADVGEIQASQASRRAIGLEPNQPEYRILVVDDRVESRLLLMKLLASLGFQVREAENGARAVEVWADWEPHLIWMDMRMPVMDGFEATKRIKSHLKGQATAILALTASAFDEERSVVLKSGCDDFVAKPFREQVILDKMAQYLGVRYVYEEGIQRDGVSSQSKDKKDKADGGLLSADSLAAMPSEWLNELYEAADSVDNDRILQLIEQIPEERAALGVAIADLVNNFRCDRLIDLIEEVRNS